MKLGRLLLFAGATFALGACGSVTPSANDVPAPSPSPSPFVTPWTASTLTPPPTPTLPPPTPTLPPTPTATPQPTATSTPDAYLLFQDAELNADTGWSQLDVNKATMTFDSGLLASTYEKKGSWAYAVRELDRAQSVVRISGSFSSIGAGYYGWLCGDPASGRYYGAVPETDDGSLVFIDGGYAGVQPLERYEDLGTPAVVGASTTMGLECTVDHGVLWMEAFVDNGEPIAVHEQEIDDVSSIAALGMYGEALEPGFTMTATDVNAYGTGGSSGSTSIEAADFIANLPSGLGGDCVERPASITQTIAVRCYVQDEGDGAEFADVTRYADATAMDAAYSTGASASTCALAVVPSTWAHGQVRCVTQTVGTRLEWTDERSTTVGRIVDFEGDAAALYAQWGDNFDD